MTSWAGLHRHAQHRRVRDAAECGGVAAALANGTFNAFAQALEGVHNSGHVWVGGSMGMIPTAPADPVFWMHHAEIDRLWSVWQASIRAESRPWRARRDHGPVAETEPDTGTSRPWASPTSEYAGSSAKTEGRSSAPPSDSLRWQELLLSPDVSAMGPLASHPKCLWPAATTTSLAEAPRQALRREASNLTLTFGRRFRAILVSAFEHSAGAFGALHPLTA